MIRGVKNKKNKAIQSLAIKKSIRVLATAREYFVGPNIQYSLNL